MAAFSGLPTATVQPSIEMLPGDRIGIVFDLSEVLSPTGAGYVIDLPLNAHGHQELPTQSLLEILVTTVSTKAGTDRITIDGAVVTCRLERYVAQHLLLPYLAELQALIAAFAGRPVRFSEPRIGARARKELIVAITASVFVVSAYQLVDWIAQSLGDEVTEATRRG